MCPLLEKIMSSSKDHNDTLLYNPSSDSVIEEENTMVIDENRYIIKDGDIKVTLVASKQGKTRFKHSLGMRCWLNLDWSKNGFIFAGRVYL